MLRSLRIKVMELSLKVELAFYLYESLIIIADSLPNDYANIARIENCKIIAILRALTGFALFAESIHPTMKPETRNGGPAKQQARHLKKPLVLQSVQPQVRRQTPISSCNCNTERRNARYRKQWARPKRSPARYTSATHKPCRLQYS